MTREEFDKKQWHKDMRCFIQIGKDMRRYGTIMKVMFGAQSVGVKFDGKDYVERVSCERITLQEDYAREQTFREGMKRNAKEITAQARICADNWELFINLLGKDIQAVNNNGGEVSIDLTDGITGYNGAWLIRMISGKFAVCDGMYHKKLEKEGLVSGEDFGF